MNPIPLIRSDERGNAIIEFAIALPVLVLLIWGMFQVALLYEANAGIQNALGEGARYATLYDSTTTSHVPDDADIKTRMDARFFGTTDGTYNSTVSTPDATTCTGCRLLRVTYTWTMNFLFFTGPTVTLDRTKRVYTVVGT